MQSKRTEKMIVATISVLLLITPMVVKATYDLPAVMTGRTSIEYNTDDRDVENDIIYPGATVGNKAVYNFQNDITIGWNKNDHGRCEGLPLSNWAISDTYCYLDNSSTTSIKILRSRTYVDGVPIIETPLLLFGAGDIMGDAYSKDEFLKNFKFWGRSLAQTEVSYTEDPNAVSNAPWRLKGYSLNENSRAAWAFDENRDTESFKQWRQNVTTLADGGTIVTQSELLTNGTSLCSSADKQRNWNLQAANKGLLSATAVSDEEKQKYPEGRVWVVQGDLFVPDHCAITYYGVGTIIVRGNLVVGKDVTIVPESDSSKLGLIVLEENK